MMMGDLTSRTVEISGIEFKCEGFDRDWGACGGCDSCRARTAITDLTRKLEIAREALEQAQVDAKLYRKTGLKEGAAYWQSGLEKINRDATQALAQLDKEN